MQETRVQFLGGEDPLEKEMAPHSSTLAWKIPWMEEPGRLQSMGSHSRTRLKRLSSSSNEISYGSDGKESACNAGGLGSIPGLGRSLGGENGNLLQDSCLENSMTEEPGEL